MTAHGKFVVYHGPEVATNATWHFGIASSASNVATGNNDAADAFEYVVVVTEAGFLNICLKSTSYSIGPGACESITNLSETRSEIQASNMTSGDTELPVFRRVTTKKQNERLFRITCCDGIAHQRASIWSRFWFPSYHSGPVW